MGLLMKNIRLVILFSLLLMSCTITSSDFGHVSEAIPSDSGVDETDKAVVTAEHALWLRDKPQEEGGVPITSMANGSQFTVYACRDGWAVGVYVSPSGQAWWGYASDRYLDNGCQR